MIYVHYVFTAERCKTKWKSLRDTYTKEKAPQEWGSSRDRKEVEVPGGPFFLRPLYCSTATSGNMKQGVEEDWTPQSRESEEEGETAGPSQRGLFKKYTIM